MKGGKNGVHCSILRDFFRGPSAYWSSDNICKIFKNKPWCFDIFYPIFVFKYFYTFYFISFGFELMNWLYSPEAIFFLLSLKEKLKESVTLAINPIVSSLNKANIEISVEYFLGMTE